MKQRQRELYGAGDYSALAAVLEPTAVALVEAVDVRHGHTLLDVAAGDGNAALAAARIGARVTATDLSTAQVQRGQRRCARNRSEVEWMVADAERLPFRADAYDRVISAFGVIFAPASAGLCVSDAERQLPACRLADRTLRVSEQGRELAGAENWRAELLEEGG